MPEQTRMVNEERLTLVPVRLQGSSRTRPQRTMAARDVRQRAADAQVESSLLPMHRCVHSHPRLPDHAQSTQVVLVPSWVWGGRKHNRKLAFLFVLGPLSPPKRLPGFRQHAARDTKKSTGSLDCRNIPLPLLPKLSLRKNHHRTAQTLSRGHCHLRAQRRSS